VGSSRGAEELVKYHVMAVTRDSKLELVLQTTDLETHSRLQKVMPEMREILCAAQQELIKLVDKVERSKG
jgi:hypothetical protein